ncbi:MAG: BLUF domain-containing protein [Bacteroidota bacterium]
MIFYLVYTSIPRTEMSAKVLEDIARSSARNNKSKGITGILLGIEGRYLQYLEGAHKNVLDLFEKLKQDGRHYEIHKWIQGFAEQRIFSEWSMASWMLSNKQISELKSVSEIRDFLDSPKSKNYPSQRFLEMMKNLLDSWIAHEPERSRKLKH